MNLEKLMSSLAGSGVLGGLAGGAVSGALVNSKKARKTAGTVLQVGGLAALGGMAWKAYQGYQAQQTQGETVQAAVSPSSDPVWGNLHSTAFDIDASERGQGSRALLLVQSMIAAANADGHLDDVERGRIMQQVSAAELAPDEKALVFDALHNPPGLIEISQRVDCPELAAEVYMASLVAVDESLSEAQMYLEALAYRLGIPQALVQQMRHQLSLAPQAVA